MENYGATAKTFGLFCLDDCGSALCSACGSPQNVVSNWRATESVVFEANDVAGKQQIQVEVFSHDPVENGLRGAWLTIVRADEQF